MPPKFQKKSKKTRTWGDIFYNLIPTRESITNAAACKVVATAALTGIAVVSPGVGELLLIQMGVGLVAGQAVKQYCQSAEPCHVVKGVDGAEYLLTEEQYHIFCEHLVAARQVGFVPPLPIAAREDDDENFVFVETAEDDQILAILEGAPPVRIITPEPQDLLSQLVTQEKNLSELIKKGKAMRSAIS